MVTNEKKRLINNVPARVELKVIIDGVEKVISVTDRELEHIISPIRRRTKHRFPGLMLITVSVGGGSMFWGIEQILSEIYFFTETPLYAFLFGVGVLFLTGGWYTILNK